MFLFVLELSKRNSKNNLELCSKFLDISKMFCECLEMPLGYDEKTVLKYLTLGGDMLGDGSYRTL